MLSFKKHKAENGLEGFRVWAGANCLGTIFYFPDGPMTWRGVSPDGTRFSAPSKPKIAQRLRIHAASSKAQVRP